MTERKTPISEIEEVAPRPTKDQVEAEPITATVIAGLSLLLAGAEGVGGILSKLLNALTSVNRKIAIAIQNYPAENLCAPEYYIFSGKIEDASLSIKGGHVGGVGASKTEGGFRGTVGVVCYSIEGTENKLAILWSIPADYGSYSNWFKLSIIPKTTPTNYDLYVDMYHDDGRLTEGQAKLAEQGSATWITGGYNISGVMGTGGSATLNIELKKA